MSTMKKLFALTLALAMLMSVSAFAGFTDTSSIDKNCVEDIQLLTAMGIIEGNADGSFGPKNTIKRSEAAAMIYRLRNGGVDDKAESWKGASSFTDVADDIWYSGYVAYCEYFGIIDGKSATIFDPNAPVTTPELAKMLLVVAGYKSDVEGYTGSNWAKNVLADATDVGLFADFGGSYAGACSREWACKLMVNAIEVETAVYLGDYLLPGGAETVGEKYLDIVGATEAIVIANDTWSVVNGGSVTTKSGNAINGMSRYEYVSATKLAEKDNILVALMEDIKDYKAGNITADEFYAETVEIEAIDDSIVGQEIKVVVKTDGSVLGYTTTGASVSGKLTISFDAGSKADDASDDKYTVLVGNKTYISAKAGTTVLADGIYQAIPNPMWLADKTIFTDKAIYANRGIADVADLGFYTDIDQVANYYNKVFSLVREGSFTAYDFDGDKTIDAVINTPVVYTRASTSGGSVGATWDVGNHNNTRDGGWYTFNAVSGMKAESIYKETFDYTTMQMSFTEKPFTIAKVEEIITDSTGAIVSVVIGGNKYTFATEGYMQYCANKTGNLAKGAKDSTWNSLLGKLVSIVADEKGNLVYAFAYTPSSGTTTTTPSTIDNSKLAYLIDVQDVTVSSTTTDEWGNVTNTPVVVKKVKVMFADGTSAIMTYDNDSKLSGAAKASALVTGKVYEYAVNADGEVVLFTNLSKATNVLYGAATSAGTAAAATLSNSVAYNLEKNRFGNVLVNDSTLIFVKYVDNKGNDVYTVMKISEFKKGIDGTSFNLVARNTSAISTALVATVEFAGGLPVDPTAPVDPDSYLIYVTSGTVKYNLGEDKDGNPINVAKFSAVDLTTGVAGDYYLKDVNGTVTAKTILTGEFNADGLIEAAPTTVTVKDFAGTLEASAWLKGKVAAKSGDIILVDSTLIDKDNLAKNYTVLVKSGNTFTVSDYASIKTVAKDQDNNIVIKTDAEGKIVLVIYTADGKAF